MYDVNVGSPSCWRRIGAWITEVEKKNTKKTAE
jgi:hypothetical protein